MASRANFEPMRMALVRASSFPPIISGTLAGWPGGLVSTSDLMKSLAENSETVDRKSSREAKNMRSGAFDFCGR